MASLDEIRAERLRKLTLLREAGMEPYPAVSLRDRSVSEAIENFVELESGAEDICLAGRVISLRGQGGLLFFDLNDGTGSFQGLLKKDEMDEKSFTLFRDTVDIGDFIEVTGIVFTSNRGERTLKVAAWKMLAKSLRPLPEKWHGLTDEEERLRRRYLDILTNPEVRAMVERRSTFWRAMRDFLLARGFMEVDTPILENIPGGAEARPFITHHNALDLDVYLRIASELWLKRLMVAGLPKVFEIGRIFRNEGMDAEHLQDYAAMEFYWAYADYEQGMIFVEEMYKDIAQKTFGTLSFKIKGFDIDLGKKWERYDYVGIIKEKTGIDIGNATLEEIEKQLRELGVDYDKAGFNLNRAIDNLWKYCRKQIAGPGFLVNVPVMMEPLAKRQADNPNFVERFQVILAGSELGKGFSELNDPIDQAGRFADQAKLREAGDEEAQMYDQDYIEAMEYGMPPICGFGVSERLFAFLCDKPLRETQIFPLMRPLQEAGQKEKGTKLAVAVINDEVDLAEWEKLNTIAHLNAAFGARSGKKLFKFDSVSTKDGKPIKLNIQHAIIIKKGSNDSIVSLAEKAKGMGLEVADFTGEMLDTNDNKIMELTKEKNLSEIKYLGVLVFGEKAKIDEITKHLELF